MDSVDNLMANTRNNPIEELDMRFPMRCDQYELRPEPAAPGKWRGGDRDHPPQPLPRRRRRTPARATGRPTRRAASSAAGTGSWPRAARTPTRRARSTAGEGDRHPVRAPASSSSSASRTRPGTATRSSATPMRCARTSWTTSRRSSSRATPTASSSPTSGRSRSTPPRRRRCGPSCARSANGTLADRVLPGAAARRRPRRSRWRGTGSSAMR